MNIKFDKNQPNFYFNLSYPQSFEHFFSRYFTIPLFAELVSRKAMCIFFSMIML